MKYSIYISIFQSNPWPLVIRPNFSCSGCNLTSYVTSVHKDHMMLFLASPTLQMCLLSMCVAVSVSGRERERAQPGVAEQVNVLRTVEWDWTLLRGKRKQKNHFVAVPVDIVMVAVNKSMFGLWEVKESTFGWLWNCRKSQDVGWVGGPFIVAWNAFAFAAS